MLIIDAQVHVGAPDTPERPWARGPAHLPVAVHVRHENVPVVDRRLPRLPRVAEHQPPLERRGIGRQALAPFAAHLQMQGRHSAKGRPSRYEAEADYVLE